MARLLVVHHSPTRATAALSDGVLAGANDEEITGVEVVARPALEASAEDVLGADGLVLVTPANFGYMSGALKHFFDSTFLSIGGSLAEDGAAEDGAAEDGAAAAAAGGKLPYGLCVHGRYDTTGAVRAVESIAGALPWRRVAPVLDVMGEVGEAEVAAAYELGATVAAGISA